MSLPVDEIFPLLTSKLTTHARVILQAPPGAGKSTRLPLLLLKSGHYSPSNQIIILEPRRVAARQIAHFLAQSLNEKVGQSIGLSMRGEHKESNQTIVRIVTDGVMVRQLQNNPELEGVGLIIFDEFHERALQTDLALALALDAQELNENVKVLIMSATLDLASLSSQLDAPIVESSGRQYPVDVLYCASSLIPTLPEVSAAVMQAVNEQSSSILVFLSGVGEIKRLMTLFADKVPQEIDVLPLYGGLSIEQQVKAITPTQEGKRKIVLATNLAQTSLTIEGVDVVVDAGTEKVMQYQHRTGTEVLVTQPVSIASATQRAGRAGRLRPGVCYRLGSKETFERRRAHDIAEIERVDLSQLLLEVNLWGTSFKDLFWLTKPEQSLINVATEKLVTLGYWKAINSGYKNTELVRSYQQAAVGLRFSKMLAKAQEHKAAEPNLLKTAIILTCYLEQVNTSADANLNTRLAAINSHEWHQIKETVNRLAKRFGLTKIEKQDLELDVLPLLLVWAYPDRIGKKQSKRWKLSNGAGVEFHREQIEPNAEFIVVADINASDYGQFVSTYVPVEYEMLAKPELALIAEQEAVEWSDTKQAPQKVKQSQIGRLVLRQSPLPLNMSDEDWQGVWLNVIKDKSWSVLTIDDLFESLLNKLQIIVNSHPELGLDALTKPSLLALLDSDENWLSPYLSNIRKLEQLKKLNLSEILLAQYDWQQQQTIQRLCPDYYQTPAGSKRPIDYSTSQPKLSVKLQEMFGEPSSPSICEGRQPLTIELLSPAQRPLQITQDLANFWQNAYVEVKKEMKGRYPKHPWPDDPVNFQATSKTKRQLNK